MEQLELNPRSKSLEESIFPVISSFLCLVPAQADMITRRNLGPARPHRIPLLPLEKRFLIDVHRRFMLGQQAQHGPHHQVDYSQMDWAEVTREFNNNFENRLLPGETFPRPMRTESALRSARPRIPAIVALTGITARKTEDKKGAKKGGKKKGKKEEGKDEAGKRKGRKK